MSWYFVPEDWKMSEELLAWTKAMGLTDKTIEKELESFRDHQYKRPMMRADACWRNWVKNGIDWGRIIPVQNPEYHQPKRISTEEREADIIKAVTEMAKYRSKQ